MDKAAAIVVALAAGASCPWAYPLAAITPWAVALMLFIGFSARRIDLRAASGLHLRLVVSAAVIGALGCAALWRLDRDLALAALLIGITPTATATPIIVGVLGGDMAFAAVAVLLSHLWAILLAPSAIRLLLGSAARLPVADMLVRVGLVIALPLVAGQFLRRMRVRWGDAVGAWQGRSFWLWVVCLFAVAANASHFVRSFPGVPAWKVLALAGLALAICLVSFSAGRRLGRPGRELEAGQALGQKNTLLTIWMATTFASPAVALGPTFYVLWHNLFNAWQLARYRRPAPHVD